MTTDQQRKFELLSGDRSFPRFFSMRLIIVAKSGKVYLLPCHAIAIRYVLAVNRREIIIWTDRRSGSWEGRRGRRVWLWLNELKRCARSGKPKSEWRDQSPVPAAGQEMFFVCSKLRISFHNGNTIAKNEINPDRLVVVVWRNRSRIPTYRSPALFLFAIIRPKLMTLVWPGPV